MALALVLLVDLAVLGTDAYLLHNRSTTTVVDLQDALSSFRSGSEPGGADEGTSALAGGAEVPGAAAGSPIPAALAVPSTNGAPTASSTPVASSAPANPKAGALTPPSPGVYRYRTTGGERVSMLDSSHSYPAETYAVVRLTGGCGWELEAEVVEEHVDRREMCTDGDRVLQLAQQRAVTFFGTTDGATMVCQPPMVQVGPDMVVGWSGETDCSAEGVTGKMVLRVTGLGSEVVEGQTVPTLTLRIEGTMTGRVRGTSLDVMTVDARTGLPVAVERWVDTVADAFGASVRYEEHATFDLVSLTPRT